MYTFRDADKIVKINFAIVISIHHGETFQFLTNGDVRLRTRPNSFRETIQNHLRQIV